MVIFCIFYFWDKIFEMFSGEWDGILEFGDVFFLEFFL